jgi:hypothetical protein
MLVEVRSLGGLREQLECAAGDTVGEFQARLAERQPRLAACALFYEVGIGRLTPWIAS